LPCSSPRRDAAQALLRRSASNDKRKKENGSSFDRCWHKPAAKLEAEDMTAIAAFAVLVASHSDDSLAEFHLRRLLNGAKGTRIDMSN
jgi:hypothetical protein